MNFKGLQVSCIYLGQCQGSAGILHIAWAVSGVCRYPAYTLGSVRGNVEIALLGLWHSIFQGASVEKSIQKAPLRRLPYLGHL